MLSTHRSVSTRYPTPAYDSYESSSFLHLSTLISPFLFSPVLIV